MQESIDSLYGSSSDEENPQVVDIQPSTSKEKQGWLELASEKLKKAGSMFSTKEGASKSDFKSKLLDKWLAFKYSDKWQFDNTKDYDQEGVIWLLGRSYAPNCEEGPTNMSFVDFIKDYYSKIWITYRTSFPAFEGTEITTDCGWGCMLRSAQMMTAQAILQGRLSRNWQFRRRKPSIVKKFGNYENEVREDIHSIEEEHYSIIKLFEDSLNAPLGIHKLVSLARQTKGIEAVGSWYSASEAVSLIKRALAASASPLTSDLAILLCVDGHLKIGEAERLTKNWTKKLLIIVTIRLGTTDINKVYYQHIQQLFSIDTCLGMLGGKPDHSLYFVGIYNREIVYLDPHVAHEYIPLINDVNKHLISTYHCKKLSKMPFYEMDPSCAVGFFIQRQEELDSMVKTLNLNQVIDVNLGEGEGEKRTKDPLFVVVYGEESTVSDTQMTTTQEEKDLADQHGFELL